MKNIFLKFFISKSKNAHFWGSPNLLKYFFFSFGTWEHRVNKSERKANVVGVFFLAVVTLDKRVTVDAWKCITSSVMLGLE